MEPTIVQRIEACTRPSQVEKLATLDVFNPSSDMFEMYGKLIRHQLEQVCKTMGGLKQALYVFRGCVQRDYPGSDPDLLNVLRPSEAFHLAVNTKLIRVKTDILKNPHQIRRSAFVSFVTELLPSKKRDDQLMLALVLVGCRVSELMIVDNFKVDDANPDTCVIQHKQSKGRVGQTPQLDVSKRLLCLTTTKVEDVVTGVPVMSPTEFIAIVESLQSHYLKSDNPAGVVSNVVCQRVRSVMAPYFASINPDGQMSAQCLRTMYAQHMCDVFYGTNNPIFHAKQVDILLGHREGWNPSNDYWKITWLSEDAEPTALELSSAEFRMSMKKLTEEYDATRIDGKGSSKRKALRPMIREKKAKLMKESPYGLTRTFVIHEPLHSVLANMLGENQKIYIK